MKRTESDAGSGKRFEMHPLNPKLARWFVLSAAVILTLTGGAKLWSAAAETPIFNEHDPIVGVSFRHLMLSTGVAELIVAVVCLFGGQPRVSLALVAWLATGFMLYRLGLWWTGWQRPCGCLGNVTDTLHLSPTTVDAVVKSILAYLLVGAYLCIWRASRKGRQGLYGPVSPSADGP